MPFKEYFQRIFLSYVKKLNKQDKLNLSIYPKEKRLLSTLILTCSRSSVGRALGC